jgi:beta-lactamase regulating signal transducer with metallopeptidase domain
MTQWIVSSSALIIVVAALRYLLRGKISLRLQYAMWALVLIRLLVPGTLGHSGVSVMNAAERMPQVRTAQSVSGYDRLDYTADGGVQGYRYGSSEPEQVAAGKTEEEYAAMNTALTAREILTRVWIAGSAVTLAVFFASNMRLGRELRLGRRELDAEGPLPVYVSESVRTPCLFGLFHPAIYVTPPSAENETELRHVLIHEVTHFRHGDNIWSVLRCLCVSVHWFNPLVWWAAELSRRDAELCCDECAVRTLGESQREAYGETIIKCACPRSRGEFLRTATTMISGGRSLRERIILLAEKPTTKTYAAVFIAAVMILASGCAFTGAAEKPSAPVSSADTAPQSAELTAEIASEELLSDKSASSCPYDNLKFSGREVNQQKFDRSYVTADEELIDDVWALVKPDAAKKTAKPETTEIGIDMYFYNADKMEFYTLFPTDYLKDNPTGNGYRLEDGTYGKVSAMLTEYTKKNYSFTIDRDFISIDTASPEKLTFMLGGVSDPIAVSPAAVGDFTADWNLKQITPEDGELGGEHAYIQNVYTKDGFGPVELEIYYDLKLLVVNCDGKSGFFSMDGAAAAGARSECDYVLSLK